jgi:hypothetical protein
LSQKSDAEDNTDALLAEAEAIFANPDAYLPAMEEALVA